MLDFTREQVNARSRLYGGQSRYTPSSTVISKVRTGCVEDYFRIARCPSKISDGCEWGHYQHVRDRTARQGVGAQRCEAQILPAALAGLREP